MTWIRFVLMLYFFMVAHKAACQTLSKAFLKSMKTWQRSCWCWRYFSQRMRRLRGQNYPLVWCHTYTSLFISVVIRGAKPIPPSPRKGDSQFYQMPLEWSLSHSFARKMSKLFPCISLPWFISTAVVLSYLHNNACDFSFFLYMQVYGVLLDIVGLSPK